AWYQAPANILESLPDGTHRWFADGRLNSAYLALEPIYDAPVTGTQDRYSYLRLRDEVARLAGALRALGVGKGDRVIIY
ncbi:AMP-binding protein, partial [Pseudomonas aeruginosa]